MLFMNLLNIPQFAMNILDWRNKLKEYHGEQKEILKEDHLQYLKNRVSTKEHDIFLAFEPIGRITVSNKTKKSCEIGVDMNPDFVNQGYGTKMMNEILESLKNKFVNIYLFVREDNERAIHFYKKVGFSITNDRVTVSKNEEQYNEKRMELVR